MYNILSLSNTNFIKTWYIMNILYDILIFGILYNNNVFYGIYLYIDNSIEVDKILFYFI